MRPGSSNSVAYIDSRSARSSTRWSAPSSSASVSALARASSSSLTSSVVRRSSSSMRAASTRATETPGRTVAQPAVTDAAADEPEREQRDVLGDPLVADEAPVEPAALAARQDLAGQVERIEPRVAEDRRPEPDVDARQRDAVEDDLAPLPAERRRQRQVAERRDVRVRRDGAEEPLGGRRDVGRSRRRRRPTAPRCSARSRSGRTR